MSEISCGLFVNPLFNQEMDIAEPEVVRKDKGRFYTRYNARSFVDHDQLLAYPEMWTIAQTRMFEELASRFPQDVGVVKMQIQIEDIIEDKVSIRMLAEIEHRIFPKEK